MSAYTRYYYCEDGETAVGPFTREKFQELLAKEVVTWEVWVTREDSADWMTAADFDEFRDFEALVASGRAGQNYHSVLEAAFSSTEEDEQRAQDLQSLQRASARIDLSRFREAASDREEVATGEKPDSFWFLRYLRYKYALILGGFLLCLALVILLVMVIGNKPKAGSETKGPGITSTRPANPAPTPGGAMGAPSPAPARNAEPQPDSNSDLEDAIQAEEEVRMARNTPQLPARGEGELTTSDGATLANSRVSVKDSPVRPADLYLLARPYSVNVDSEMVSMKEGQKVRVIERQPDVWMVEADNVRFQVAPTDLRRENSEAVSTVGTPALNAGATGMASESASFEGRSNGSGVPPPAIPSGPQNSDSEL